MFMMIPDWILNLKTFTSRTDENVFFDMPPLEINPYPSNEYIQYFNNEINKTRSSSHSCSCYIFDEIYGIIPRHVHDLWEQQQVLQNNNNKVIKRKNCKLPPVRKLFNTNCD